MALYIHWAYNTLMVMFQWVWPKGAVSFVGVVLAPNANSEKLEPMSWAVMLSF
jgi:hypothetical protein